MGNKAVITTRENYKHNGVGIYVHWGGDAKNVQRWLDTCKRRGYRKPEEDCYGWAWLIKVITEDCAPGLSVGVDRVDNLDCNNGDNGVWLIEDWKIVGTCFNEEGWLKLVEEKEEEEVPEGYVRYEGDIVKMSRKTYDRIKEEINKAKKEKLY